MRTVSKTEFEAFVKANCPSHARLEPRVERDVEYSYECFDDDDGNEIAFVSYKTGEEPLYSIR